MRAEVARDGGGAIGRGCATCADPRRRARPAAARRQSRNSNTWSARLRTALDHAPALPAEQRDAAAGPPQRLLTTLLPRLRERARPTTGAAGPTPASRRNLQAGRSAAARDGPARSRASAARSAPPVEGRERRPARRRRRPVASVQESRPTRCRRASTRTSRASPLNSARTSPQLRPLREGRGARAVDRLDRHRRHAQGPAGRVEHDRAGAARAVAGELARRFRTACDTFFTRRKTDLVRAQARVGRERPEEGSAVRARRSARRVDRLGRDLHRDQAAAGRVEDGRPGPQEPSEVVVEAVPRRVRQVLRALRQASRDRAAASRLGPRVARAGDGGVGGTPGSTQESDASAAAESSALAPEDPSADGAPEPRFRRTDPRGRYGACDPASIAADVEPSSPPGRIRLPWHRRRKPLRRRRRRHQRRQGCSTPWKGCGDDGTMRPAWRPRSSRRSAHGSTPRSPRPDRASRGVHGHALRSRRRHDASRSAVRRRRSRGHGGLARAGDRRLLRCRARRAAEGVARGQHHRRACQRRCADPRRRRARAARAERGGATSGRCRAKPAVCSTRGSIGPVAGSSTSIRTSVPSTARRTADLAAGACSRSRDRTRPGHVREARRGRSAPDAPDDRSACRMKRVLAINAPAGLLQLLRDALVRDDCEVHEERSGLQALHALRARSYGSFSPIRSRTSTRIWPWCARPTVSGLVSA